MRIVPFTPAHTHCFLASAWAEGWITDQREMDFLLGAYPDGCLVAEVSGRPIGFITAISYARSAWIGNLIVLPEQRQRGVARMLMKRVLHALDLLGCQTVWLTASADGAHLYRTLGFRQLDRVLRWKGRTVPNLSGNGPPAPEIVVGLDSLGWGDNRRALLASLKESSTFSLGSDGYLFSAMSGEGRHIGPWGALSVGVAGRLFSAANGSWGSGVDTFLDVPEGNCVAGGILSSNGFSVKGSTLLMYRGNTPEYRPEYIYSLASMGSYG